MKYLRLFENFETTLTVQYLKDNFPIEMDDFYLSNFGKERFFVMIDDKPSYFSNESGVNLTKEAIVNILKEQSLINDERNDIPIVKEYLRTTLNSKRFIWIHGLPGSGKSYLANKITESNNERNYQILDDIYELNTVKEKLAKAENIILSSPYFENYLHYTKLFQKLNTELENHTHYFIKNIWFENNLKKCLENLEKRKEHKIKSNSIIMEIPQYSKDYIIPARAITIPVYSDR